VAHHPGPNWKSSDGLLIGTFRHGPLWNFSYVIACEETGVAAVIDPAWGVPELIAETTSRGLTIESALLTHTHSDHANGVAELVEKTGARVFVHGSEARAITGVARGAAMSVADEDTLAIGRVMAQVLHTPGHTPGSISILARGTLFTGDTLPIGSPGTPGPEPEALEALWWSISEVIGRLNHATVIHPGHDSGPAAMATLGSERGSNPALLARSFDEFVRIVEGSTGRRQRD
jgi:glyoxylase-like metal-dependent hydrolase (beta-lactamase superfamily II)